MLLILGSGRSVDLGLWPPTGTTLLWSVLSGARSGVEVRVLHAYSPFHTPRGSLGSLPSRVSAGSAGQFLRHGSMGIWGGALTLQLRLGRCTVWSMSRPRVHRRGVSLPGPQLCHAVLPLWPARSSLCSVLCCPPSVWTFSMSLCLTISVRPSVLPRLHPSLSSEFLTSESTSPVL